MFQLEDREREATREGGDRKLRGSDRPTSSRPSVQSSSNKRARLEGPGHAGTSNLDADEPLDDSDDSDDSDSDDDDTAALMAELQKIKQEKAQEEEEKVKYLKSVQTERYQTNSIINLSLLVFDLPFFILLSYPFYLLMF